MSQNTNRTKQKKKNPLVLLAPLLIFAVGAGIFLYPAVSNFLAERNQSNVIHTYQAKVNELDQEEIDEAWAEAIEYNENLAGDPVHDPFVMGSGYVLPDNYEEVLNLNGDGVMGYVEIPKIDVYLPIYHGTSEEVLAEGAGHLDVTALPIGGEGNHSVISAHRGLPSAELFTRLDEMEEGDTFYIHVLDQTLAYEVDQIEVILPEELTLLQPEEGKDLVTLLTCTPYAVNTHRCWCGEPECLMRRQRPGTVNRYWILIPGGERNI
jgi:sortase A